MVKKIKNLKHLRKWLLEKFPDAYFDFRSPLYKIYIEKKYTDQDKLIVVLYVPFLQMLIKDGGGGVKEYIIQRFKRFEKEREEIVIKSNDKVRLKEFYTHSTHSDI